MFVICLFFLRELSPGIRSQRMTAMNERALVEARAEGVDLQHLTKNRWRQMLHVSTVLSPIAINLFLIIYFTAIAYFVFYLPASLACCYGPWFASFTETLEFYNPGLIATGSSLYGFAPWLVGVPFGIVIPHIVGSPLETASGWRTWFYMCVGCVVVFVPFIFTMHGHWRPSKARAEFRTHSERVAAELARLKGAELALEN